MQDYINHIQIYVRIHNLITGVKFGIFKEATMENGVFRDVTSCSLVHETDISEARVASILSIEG